MSPLTKLATIRAYYTSIANTLKERGIDVGRKPNPTLEDVLELHAICLKETDGRITE